MKAIHTKYLPETKTRGPRVKAYTTEGISLTIPFDHSQPTLMLAHYAAVYAMVKAWKLQWPVKEMCWGETADGNGYVFCFLASKVEV